MGFKFSKISKSIKNSAQQASKSAIKPIVGPITKIWSTVKGFGKAIANFLKPIIGALRGIFKMIGTVFKQLISAVKVVVKGFVNIFKRLFKALKDAFLTIFFYIKCAVKRLQNTPRCMLYYSVDIIFFTLLIPVRIIIFLFPVLEEFEDSFKDTIDMVDGIIYDLSKQVTGNGIHINRWPDGVLNKCYRCKPHTEDGGGDSSRFLKELTEMTNNEATFFTFFLRASMIIMGIAVPGFYIYRYYMQKRCTPIGNIF